MDYTLYLIFMHHIIGSILSTTAFYYSVKLLFINTFKVKKWYLTPALTVYYSFVFTTSTCSLLLYTYIFIFWRFETNIYHPQLLYLLICVQWVFLNVSPIAEFFLAADRCLILINCKFYKHEGKTVFVVFNILTVIFSGGIFLYLNNVFTSMPNTGTTTCRFAGCLFMESPYKMVTKASYSFINFVAGIILAILIKQNFKENTVQTRRLNKTMLYILMTTTIIELIPFISGQIFNTLTGTQLIEYIGPYGNTLFMTNIAILSSIYYKALSRTFNNNINSHNTVVPSSRHVICNK